MGQAEEAGRTWAIFCHLGALSLYIGVPLGHILVPLVIWLIKKDELGLVDDNGKASLNFQLSISIYAILAAIAYVVFLLAWFVVTGNPPLRVLFLFIPVVMLLFIFAHLVLTIVASVKVGEGRVYCYPLAIRFFR